MSAPFHYQAGALYADGVALCEIAEQAGTPCYVYSRDRILENFHRIRAAFPTAEIHYSLKANANLALIRTLIQAGARIDAVSGGEIFRAVAAGAAPDQIVFAGVGKSKTDIGYALETGIGWFNVESAQELVRLDTLAQSKDKRARAALRINPDIQADTHPYIATGHSAAKFGIPLSEAAHLLDQYADASGVSIQGLHIHIGSQLGTLNRTAEAIQAVLPLFDTHRELTSLNIGGGFPVSYTGEPVQPVEAFAEAVNSCLAGRALTLMLEPGRYVVADAGLLLTAVEYVKSAPDGAIVVTDAGMTELIRPALYSAKHHVMPVIEPSSDIRVNTHVVGPICESADVLRTDILLPPVKPGDLLAVMHAGAYGAVMASTYNARPRASEVLVEGDTWRVVRRRETWEDLIALDS